MWLKVGVLTSGNNRCMVDRKKVVHRLSDIKGGQEYGSKTNEE